MWVRRSQEQSPATSAANYIIMVMSKVVAVVPSEKQKSIFSPPRTHFSRHGQNYFSPQLNTAALSPPQPIPLS